jgi:hypothetical protein
LVLVIGAGRAIVHTAGTGINGGLVIINLDESAESHTFGDPEFSIQGNSLIRSDDGAVGAALSLIPPERLSFREIAGTDP